MSRGEITIEDRVIENSAMNRLLDYVLATMEEMQRREDHNGRTYYLSNTGNRKP